MNPQGYLKISDVVSSKANKYYGQAQVTYIDRDKSNGDILRVEVKVPKNNNEKLWQRAEDIILEQAP